VPGWARVSQDLYLEKVVSVLWTLFITLHEVGKLANVAGQTSGPKNDYLRI
jgi:hypothetical protein